jgi:hypothetical protein
MHAIRSSNDSLSDKQLSQIFADNIDKPIPFACRSPWNGCKAEFGRVHGGGRISPG